VANIWNTGWRAKSSGASEPEAEPIVYQALQSGEISLYPTFSGSIETEILQELLSTEPNVVWTRANKEMSRTAQLELLNPLGYENPPAMTSAPPTRRRPRRRRSARPRKEKLAGRSE